MHFRIEKKTSIYIKIPFIKQDTSKLFSTTSRSTSCKQYIHFSSESFMQIPPVRKAKEVPERHEILKIWRKIRSSRPMWIESHPEQYTGTPCLWHSKPAQWQTQSANRTCSNEWKHRKAWGRVKALLRKSDIAIFPSIIKMFA